MTPLQYVLLIVGGGTAVPTSVFLVARHLVHQHAEQYGPVIRAAGRDLDAPTEAATFRVVHKEFTR